uniref:AAA+ ATPase domain-containing protein n=1 Tax=Percolomonas cosmopolitus TaxID=63605 RepID=A0A7S1KUK3_9EUKA|mmetsp:Transcript_936/g.3220  ORF Transcript_936/g.3220 Transcript_936/m.3220 type:complete len:527 (+) Transcript_936:873-2453(+)
MKASDFQDKSVLIYGKPGIGKTTAARLVAESLGFEVLEMNASDTRSKNSLKEQVAQLVDNQSMFRYCTNLSSNASSAANTKKRQCLIMDEVDGMSTGDRGGIAELLKIIRTSRMPIICIANDGRDQKLKSLRAYSMDMQFDAPPEQVIFVKMRNLCQKENLKITDQALRNIINSLDGDIRAIVTNLQFMAKRQTKEKSQQIMQGAQDVQKDSQIPNIFSLADSILRYHQNFPPRWNQMTVASKSEYLKGAPRPLKQFIDYYFYDTMFIPLLIEQNYINMHPYILKDVQEPHLSDQRFKRINSAAESISFSDLVDVRIRRDQAWEVAPLHAVTSTIVPSLFVRGNYHRVMPYDSHSIKFPSILGKSSAARKNQVELGDLSASISTTGNASGVDLILDGYAEMLDRKFGTILKTDDGIDEAIKLMQEYNLSRSDLDLLAKHAQCIMPTGALSFSGVSANTKRALTKAYKEQIGGESVGRVAKAKRGKSLDEASESDEDETDDEPEFKPVVTKKKTASFASKKRKSKKK